MFIAVAYTHAHKSTYLPTYWSWVVHPANAWLFLEEPVLACMFKGKSSIIFSVQKLEILWGLDFTSNQTRPLQIPVSRSQDCRFLRIASKSLICLPFAHFLRISMTCFWWVPSANQTQQGTSSTNGGVSTATLYYRSGIRYNFLQAKPIHIILKMGLVQWSSWHCCLLTTRDFFVLKSLLIGNS